MNTRIRTLAAEDEALVREGLVEWLQQLPQLQPVAACGDGHGALAADAEAGLAPLPAVIFTTAYDAHALTAFELHAVDDLLKPFTQERLAEAVAHAAAASAARWAAADLVRLPITSFAARLDPARLLKLSHSCIVNLDFGNAMTPDDSSQFIVQMRDGTRVTASREVGKQLRAQSL